jgi:hypothetical protein
MLVHFPRFCLRPYFRLPPPLGIEQSAYMDFAVLQFASNQATPHPKLGLLPTFLEEVIGKRRKASANDGSQQCAGYTDDRGENRYVHAPGYGVVNPKPLGRPYSEGRSDEASFRPLTGHWSGRGVAAVTGCRRISLALLLTTISTCRLPQRGTDQPLAAIEGRGRGGAPLLKPLVCGEKVRAQAEKKTPCRTTAIAII